MEPVIETHAVGVDDVYERHAAGYDRLVGSRLYNALVWGSDTRDYVAFARRAVDSAGGPLLEVAAGSCFVTAEPYLASDRTIVVTDRSASMLREAALRLRDDDGTVRPGTRFVQADAFDLPFEPGEFDTVLCVGFLHIVDDPEALVDCLRSQLAPGGRLFLTSLVTGTALGTRYLALLHRRGIVAQPRSADDLADLFQTTVRRRGSMAYLEL